MTQITEHFSVEEMACRCGCGLCEMDHDSMIALEEMRYDLQEPLHVTSGMRCEKHNAAQKDSSPFSWHLKGKAADLRWIGNKRKMLSVAIKLFDGIGIGKTYLHVDKGGVKKVWIY